MSNYIIGFVLEMRHVINNTKNESIVTSRILQQTDNYKKIILRYEKKLKYYVERTFKNTT